MCLAVVLALVFLSLPEFITFLSAGLEELYYQQKERPRPWPYVPPTPLLLCLLHLTACLVAFSISAPRRCCQQAGSCLAAGIKALQITENSSEAGGGRKWQDLQVGAAEEHSGELGTSAGAGTERGLQTWTESQRFVSSSTWCSGFLCCFVIHRRELR